MTSQAKKLEALELIGARPGLRTVQLSELLDMDIEDVKDILAEHANASTIDVHDVVAPNGKDANAYTLHGVVLPGERQRGEMTAAAAVEPETATAKQGTKIDQAVAFIEANGGRVSGSAMHAHLGLKPEDYPSQYLASGIGTGRLIKDPETKDWLLGEFPKTGRNVPINPQPKPPVPARKFNMTIGKKKDTGPKAQFDHKAPLEPESSRDVPAVVIADGAGATVINCTKTPEVFEFPKTLHRAQQSNVAQQLVDDMAAAEALIGDALAAAPPTKYFSMGSSILDKEIKQVMARPQPGDTDHDEEGDTSISQMLHGAEQAFSQRIDDELGSSILRDWNLAQNLVHAHHQVSVDHEETTFAIWSNGDFQIAVNGRVTQTLAAKDVDAMRRYLARFPNINDMVQKP